MDQAMAGWYEKSAAQVLKKLGKHGIAGSYAPTVEEARQKVMALIPSGATVSREVP